VKPQSAPYSVRPLGWWAVVSRYNWQWEEPFATPTLPDRPEMGSLTLEYTGRVRGRSARRSAFPLLIHKRDL
jgi:hypothetical protein